MLLRHVPIGFFLLICGGLASVEAAAPNPKAKPKTAQTLPSVDGDKLPPGQFAGTVVNLPGSDRMFTLKITYPEVRLKPGAKMPNLNNMHARGMHQTLQQMHQAQQTRGGRGYHRGGHYSALSNMMHMQQMYVQGQQRMAQAMARAQQKELQLLQQEIRAIQNMYQVVPATRNFDFQAEETVKVRIKDLPEQFDDKGNIKSYTAQEKSELKGKDKTLVGYESSIDNLKVGQIVLVSLRVHKDPKPANKLIASVASNKDQDADKDKDAEKDKDKDADASVQHKMQVRLILIVKDSDAPQYSTTAAPKKKKNK